MSTKISIPPHEYINVFKSRDLWPIYDPLTHTMSFYYKIAGKNTNILAESVSYDEIHDRVYADNKGNSSAWYYADRTVDRLILINKNTEKIHVYDIGSVQKISRVLLNVANQIFNKYTYSLNNYNTTIDRFPNAFEAYEYLIRTQDLFEIQFIKEGTSL